MILFGPHRLDAEDIAKRVVVEAYQEGLALADGRRAQVARRTQHMCQKCGIVGSLLLHIEGGHLPPFGHDDSGGIRGQLECILASELGGRADGFFRSDVVLGKEPLRFGARCSPVAVIVPIDLTGHV